MLFPAYGSSTEASRLLDLQEERILVVVAPEEHDVAAGADTPHADDLAREVDEGVAVQQRPQVVADRGPVGLGDRAQAIFQLLVTEVDDQRRVVDDPEVAALDGGHLGQRLEVIAMRRLEQAALEVLADVWRHDRGDVRPGDPVVPDGQVAHRRELGHPLAIGADGGGGGGGAIGRLVPVRAAGDDDAGGQALDVPLPGGREGLVEVVDVEDLVALRRGEGAEVREVGVAAGLDGQARSWASPPGRCAITTAEPR